MTPAQPNEVPQRILFLTHYFPPEGNAPANRVHEMCTRWVAAGHDVTVITCAPNIPNGVVYAGYRNRLRRQHETVDGIDVIRVWTLLAPNKGRIRRTLNYVSYLFSASWVAIFRRRPDVLIATSPQFFCGLAGSVVRMLRRPTFVLEIRDIWPESISTVGAVKSRLLLKPLEWLESLMYWSADHIVTVGAGYSENLIERGVAPNKLSIVTNGIDPEVYAPQPPSAELRASLGLEGKFVCAFIGTIGMACGLDVVLRAAQELRRSGEDDIAFLLVGDGAVREQLQQRAAEQGLDNVVFTGRVDKPEMPRYLASVDVCLVHLAKRDLFRSVLPSKVFEAAAMERPIVLGVEGHAKELVVGAGIGVAIEPENEQELLAALRRMRDEPEVARRLGAAGRELVRREYDRGVLSAKYLDVLRDACAARRD